MKEECNGHHIPGTQLQSGQTIFTTLVMAGSGILIALVQDVHLEIVPYILDNTSLNTEHLFYIVGNMFFSICLAEHCLIFSLSKTASRMSYVCICSTFFSGKMEDV